MRVIGGAPPPAGPARLHFWRGGRVRFRVASDIPIEVVIRGYGLRTAVDGVQLISFRAARAGVFPVIVAASHIAIASLRVAR